MKDKEDIIIDAASKALCCIVVGVVSYILFRLINFEALSAAVVSTAAAVVLFFSMLSR